jgi:hypothetical protein
MRILRLDGTEICRMLSFSRCGEDASAQVAPKDEAALSTLVEDLQFEDDSAERFLGAVLATSVYPTGAVLRIALHER